jgi:hypothetical protein
MGSDEDFTWLGAVVVERKEGIGEMLKFNFTLMENGKGVGSSRLRSLRCG